MTGDEVLNVLLKSFARYYDVNSETPVPPFAATAEFHSHTEQYFLIKQAHLSDMFSNEYVYFSVLDRLDTAKMNELKDIAWKMCLEKVNPIEGHRNTDAALFIIADHVDEDTKELVKPTKLHKSYAFTFRGWSDFKLIVMETSTNTLLTNRAGKDYRKLFKTIIN